MLKRFITGTVKGLDSQAKTIDGMIKAVNKQQESMDIEWHRTVAAEKYEEMEKKPKVFQGIMSSTHLDRHKEVMLPKGALIKDFLDNPQFLRRHSHVDDPLGSILAVGITDDKMYKLFHFDEEDEEALKMKGRYERGTMRAFSIGFVPSAGGVKYISEEDRGKSVTVKVRGEDFDVDLGQYDEIPKAIHHKYTVLEDSGVNVGSNPAALMLGAFKDLRQEVMCRSLDSVKIEEEPFVQATLDEQFATIEKLLNEFEGMQVTTVKGPVRKHTTPIDLEKEWSGAAARVNLAKWASPNDSGNKDEINFAKYSRGFGWFDSAAVDNLGSYKLPHHDVINNTLTGIWRGITAAMEAVLGARGGVDIPEADKRQVYNHLAQHYKDNDVEPPEFKDYNEQELKLIVEDTYGKDTPEIEADEKATRVTGETSGHTHEYDDTRSGSTSSVNAHTHPYVFGESRTEAGGGDDHTHSLSFAAETMINTDFTKQLSKLVTKEEFAELIMEVGKMRLILDYLHDIKQADKLKVPVIKATKEQELTDAKKAELLDFVVSKNKDMSDVLAGMSNSNLM